MVENQRIADVVGLIYEFSLASYDFCQEVVLSGLELHVLFLLCSDLELCKLFHQILHTPRRVAAPMSTYGMRRSIPADAGTQCAEENT